MATADRIRVLFAQDLFSFDYSKFTFPSKGDSLDVLRVHYDKFIHPAVPIVGVLMYLLLSKPLCDLIRSICGQEEGKNSPAWKSFMKNFGAVHSAILAVYSGWTFYNTFGMVLSVTAARQAANPGLGWVDAFYLTNCDHNAQMWMKTDFGTWVYHFYISKYWEFLDTWIIYLKAGKPIFLQTFHHAGIVILMWSFCASHNNTMGICVTVLNSFIHTIMYSYYTGSALGFGFLKFLKPFITSAQLTQFIGGILYSTPTYWMKDCHTDATWWTQFAVNLYTICLIGLFGAFSYQEYFVKAKKEKEARAAKTK